MVHRFNIPALFVLVFCFTVEAGPVRTRTCLLKFIEKMNVKENGTKAFPLSLIEVKLDKPVTHIFGDRELSIVMEPQFKGTLPFFKKSITRKLMNNHLFKETGLIDDFATENITDLMVPNAKYTFAIQDKQLTLARTGKGIVDKATKHSLMTGNPKNGPMRMGGEAIVDENGVFHFDQSSGTFQPSAEDLANAEVFFKDYLGIKKVKAHLFNPAEPSAISAVVKEPGFFKISPQIKSSPLFKQLTPTEAGELSLALERYKNSGKMSEVDLFEEVLNIQKKCLPGGIYKNGCIQTQIALLEEKVEIANFVHRGPSQQTTAPGFVANVLRNVVDVNDKTFFVAVDQATQAPFTIKFNRKLGAGMAGEVYDIKSVSGLPGVTKTDELVLKLPMNLKESLGGKPMVHSKFLQKMEVDVYDQVKVILKDVETAQDFPTNPAWASGEMPVIPIVKTVETEKGLLILKPKVTGLAYKDIYRKYGTELPENMKAEMKNIYDWSQALTEKVKVKGLHPLDPIFTGHTHNFMNDINPTNLLWIEDPVQLKKYKLKRPTFILYELGENPGGKFQKEKISFDQYVDLFLQRAKADVEAP